MGSDLSFGERSRDGEVDADSDLAPIKQRASGALSFVGVFDGALAREQFAERWAL